MMKRTMFFVLMSSAVAVPYLLTHSGKAWSWLTSHAPGAATPAETAHAAVEHFSAERGSFGPPSRTAQRLPVEGYGAADLGEVIQFEGSPAWVMARWPRVTAGLAELDLQGYRVPLVTGTADEDLAGSLTYYFDRNQQIARISFHGTTGDPRKLVALVTSRYDFQPQKTQDPSLWLYQVKWNGKPTSELRIRPARIVRADQPRARYEVDLAMKRP